MDHSLFAKDDWIDEAMLAMRGKRLCTTFGTWRGKELEESAADPGDWIPVCSLQDLAAARDRQEAWAVAMWSQIKRTPLEESNMSPTTAGVG
jgi:hypothetical protein